MIVNSTTKVRVCPDVLCLSKCELCGLKQPSGCSSGERTVQAGHLQGQVHTAGGQQLRRLCVPGQQLRARRPVRVHGDARPQQRPSPRCVPSVLTAGLDFLSSRTLPSSLKLFIGKRSAFLLQIRRVFLLKPLTDQTSSCARAPAASCGSPSGKRLRHSGTRPPSSFGETPGCVATTPWNPSQSPVSSCTPRWPASTCSDTDTRTASAKRRSSG